MLPAVEVSLVQRHRHSVAQRTYRYCERFQHTHPAVIGGVDRKDRVIGVDPADASDSGKRVRALRYQLGAFACTDVFEVARRARTRGLPFLSVPDNYYDYVAGRFGVDAATVAELRELDLRYDRSPRGEFIHFYTRTVGSVSFEFVERRGDYDGYGSDNAPARLAAQRAGRLSSRR